MFIFDLKFHSDADLQILIMKFVSYAVKLLLEFFPLPTLRVCFITLSISLHFPTLSPAHIESLLHNTKHLSPLPNAFPCPH
jgi:hypothetical protein